MLRALSFLHAGRWCMHVPVPASRLPSPTLSLRWLAIERGGAPNATQPDPHPREPFVEEDAQGDVDKVAANLRAGALAEHSGTAEDATLKNRDHTSLENMETDPTNVESYYKSKAKEAGSNEMLRMQNNPDIADAAVGDERNVSIGTKERRVTGSQNLEKNTKSSKD